MLEMLRDGSRAEEELVRDLRVGETTGREREDVRFPGAQPELSDTLRIRCMPALVDEQDRRVAVDAAHHELRMVAFVDARLDHLQARAEPALEERARMGERSVGREPDDLASFEAALERVDPAAGIHMHRDIPVGSRKVRSNEIQDLAVPLLIGATGSSTARRSSAPSGWKKSV
jgi:hypothetical protein